MVAAIRILGDSVMTPKGHEIIRYGQDGQVTFRSLNGRQLFPLNSDGTAPNRRDRRKAKT
jgi:hypothetical protein